MTQVNFYTLSNKDPEARWQFACRLTEKARELGHQVYIQTDNREQAQLLDDLLWRFKTDSFVPHRLLDVAGANPSEVEIAARSATAVYNDVLINLTSCACTNFQQFSRVNEIVAADGESISNGRERYRFYRDAGVTPETFKI